MAENNKTNKALLPLSWLYGLGVWFRNKLFDWRILPSEEFSIPVISIGNISVGGTGKTPHTEYLIRIFSKKYKVAVLSRGYKRKTKGFILADEKASSQTIGDEPYQMFLKFPQIQVAVDADRRRGIKNLLSLPEDQRPEIILLDDALQHRYVTPSLSILLTDSNRPYYEDFLLPVGRLRESSKNHSRADIVIVTKCPQMMKAMDYRVISGNLNLFPYQDTYFTSYQYGNLTPVFPQGNDEEGKNIQIIDKHSTSILLVAGIAYPEELVNYINSFTAHLSTLLYPDHHDFTIEDIKKITSTFEQISSPDKIIITTEKDAVRLLGNKHLPESIKSYIYYLPIEVSFHLEQENSFIQKIENHVKDITRNRIMA